MYWPIVPPRNYAVGARRVVSSKRTFEYVDALATLGFEPTGDFAENSHLPANTDVGFQLCTLIGSPTQRRSACRPKITKLELAISTSKFCLKIFLHPAHGSKLQAGVAQWCSKSFASFYWRLETGFQDSWCAFAGLQRSNERRLFCSIMGNRCWCDDF